MKNAVPVVLQVMEEVFVLSKKRLKFSKLNMAKYISHLDLLRCFTRSIMRADLPVKYSQGFNPHQKITFSLPLSIGVTSVSEFVDIDFEDGTSNNEIMDKLNQNLPPDMKILAVYDPKMSANDIISANYDITLISDKKISPELVQNFFEQEELIIMKKTKKKGERPVNLMDFIKEYHFSSETQTENGYAFILRLELSAGGQSNLKPEIAVNSLIEFLADDISVSGYDIMRTNIFCQNDGSICAFE